MTIYTANLADSHRERPGAPGHYSSPGSAAGCAYSGTMASTTCGRVHTRRGTVSDVNSVLRAQGVAQLLR